MIKHTVVGVGLFVLSLSAQAITDERYCQVSADFAERTAKKRDKGQSLEEQQRRLVARAKETNTQGSAAEERLFKIIRLVYEYEDTSPEGFSDAVKRGCMNGLK